jgi:predicted HTH transcriptional regulator
VNNQLIKLIREGEHQKQDFKYCITDSRKIARSLVAFANTAGGSLLIGVKDNGNIVGVQSDEEYYMVESAARIFSRPPIAFTTRQWHYEGKTVLQVTVEPSTGKPHFAKDENGKWMAYVRYKDENRLAGKVMTDVWNKQKSPEGITIKLSDAEKFLLQYLDSHDFISVSAYARKAGLPYRQAEQLLSDFIVLGIVQPYFGDAHVVYQLNKNFDVEDWAKKKGFEMRHK